MKFIDKLREAVRRNNSRVCVGLDSDYDKLPKSAKTHQNPQGYFNKRIIEATKKTVCAYKINIAFYECRGAEGWKSLEITVNAIPEDIPIIIDAKRADIGNTAKKYAQAFYEYLNADAVTVNPYLGIDGIKPFLEYPDKCAFVLCHTSNRSSIDFQRLRVMLDADIKSDDIQIPLKRKLSGKRFIGKGKGGEDVIAPNRLFEVVARRVAEWDSIGSCGLVVGANASDDFKSIIEIAPGLPLLIPGIGAQGGDIKETVSALEGTDFLINSSRGIIFADGYDDFAEGAYSQASALRDIINDILMK